MALLPGLTLTGKEAPLTEKPVPETLAERMVSELLPVDVMVRDCFTDEPTSALPKASDVGLRLKAALGGYKVKANVLVTEFAAAEIVTDWVELTLPA